MVTSRSPFVQPTNATEDEEDGGTKPTPEGVAKQNKIQAARVAEGPGGRPMYMLLLVEVTEQGRQASLRHQIALGMVVRNVAR